MKRLIPFLFILAACGSNTHVCQPGQTPSQDACPPGVVADPSANVCSDESMGAQGARFVCPNGLGFCVVCQGGTFSDGCQIQSSYCVHDCSSC